MHHTEPIPLEQRILELLRVQWARAHATQAFVDGAIVEARIVYTQQGVRVEVQARASQTMDHGREMR